VALATQILRAAVLDLDANVREEALKASSQSHQLEFDEPLVLPFGYGSISINTIFNGMNIHLPAILMFTRGTRF
jgi:hypothetical protein